MAAPAPTQLGRQATGLARFYMDCGWWRHPRFTGLPPEALLLLMAIISHGYEHGTDGLAPAAPEDLAAALGLRVTVVRKGLTPLLERGSLIPTDNGMVAVRDWADHNPTSDEVAGYRRERARSGTIGNHNRWHRDRGVTDPDCRYCDRSTDRSSDTGDGEVIDESAPSDREVIEKRSAEGSKTDPSHGDHTSTQSDGSDHKPAGHTPNRDRNSDPNSDRSSDPLAIAKRSHGMGWDGSETDLVSSPTGRAPGARADQTTDQPSGPALRVAQARATRLGRTNTAWINTVARDIAGPDLDRLIDAGHSSREIDLILDGKQPNGYPPNDRPPEPRALEHYAAAETERRAYDAAQPPPADPATAKTLAAQAKAQMHPRAKHASATTIPTGEPMPASDTTSQSQR